jgi:HD-GYP domain-containing protein (c-di-GMP phosphodiesterase class II)
MRQHPAIGERIVCSVPALAAVGPILRATNERWDGTGYPDGKAGEDIPLASRVIAVCAAWQAMTGGPPYREPLSREQALAELEAAAGTQFDAGVVYLLPAALRDGPRKPAPRARALLSRARG